MIIADYILLGHAPKDQAINTRYPDKNRDELKQTVLSFVQL
jgi:hypothetical protein